MASLKPLRAYNLRSEHPKLLQDFASDLKKALDGVTPTAHGYYRDVSVLAFRWQNDDMRVGRLESELLNIFEGVYNFRTESYEIPVIRSHHSLNYKLLSWSNSRGGDHTLRIVVYSGHAEFAGTTDFRWFIAGQANANGYLMGPRIDWRGVSGAIDTIEGDILYIFDCCSAASAAMEPGPETIAASGWGQMATGNPDFSFTQVLIDTLNDLKGAPATAAGIYARLFRNAYQNQIGACPVHIPKKGSPSITLQKLEPREVQRLKALKAPGSNRVLISVKTRDEISELDLKSWTKWLTTNMPPGVLAVDVKIEAAFQGSGLILVTMPVELWTMLPADDSAYRFIAHVTSNNTLPRLTQGLPIRPAPPSGPENQPFHRQGK
ncbi:hypothetical protein ANOM_002283 [Aspergillus nomiae NRRL 13137]|uniref:Uncharacterized protein n=1 Tax=Aspergillus nomiae NRRL (strain ATCC 15546 / NRRL 13137 / CBS 260.88 / M93) TaxID=1509407 RepID=A0A0L1JDK8_ASPN3|nr:uncharacterized protein ANOM_002283 [Aspergillus nomiae NRRL 13137]KNG89483.1 hypothetical protein ANOM_002283 [Aspergillus nomiae NRRL 13137]